MFVITENIMKRPVFKIFKTFSAIWDENKKNTFLFEENLEEIAYGPSCTSEAIKFSYLKSEL